MEPSFFPSIPDTNARFSIAGSRNDFWCDDDNDDDGDNGFVENTRTAGMGAKRPKGEEFFFMQIKWIDLGARGLTLFVFEVGKSESRSA